MSVLSCTCIHTGIVYICWDNVLYLILQREPTVVHLACRFRLRFKLVCFTGSVGAKHVDPPALRDWTPNPRAIDSKYPYIHDISTHTLYIHYTYIPVPNWNLERVWRIGESGDRAEDPPHSDPLRNCCTSFAYIAVYGESGIFPLHVLARQNTSGFSNT